MAYENLVKISDLPLGHRTGLEGSFVPVALPNQQTYKVPLEEFTDHLEIMVVTSASTTGGVATVSIEQGKLCIVDLSAEASLTAIEIVLTNNASVAFPLWWFKIKAGSNVTLSVKIGGTAVGWLGSAIANIELGKTIEVSVVDGIACGGELV